MRTRQWVAALAVPLLLATGCGDEEPSASDEPSAAESQASESPSPSDEPTADLAACEEVWQDGVDLAKDYKGCLEDGTAVEPDQQACSFGKALVTYADRFYAVRGGRIHETSASLDEDRGYRSAMKSCTA